LISNGSGRRQTNEREGADVATKADFTEEEWQVLQWAAMNTIAYLSMSDKGFWDTFKEASGAAKYIADAKANSASLLVRDLAGDVRTKRDKEATSNPAVMGDEVAERVAEASALVAEKAPDEFGAFREFILGIAKATAQAAEGVSEPEAGAMEKIEAALG